MADVPLEALLEKIKSKVQLIFCMKQTAKSICTLHRCCEALAKLRQWLLHVIKPSEAETYRGYTYYNYSNILRHLHGLHLQTAVIIYHQYSTNWFRRTICQVIIIPVCQTDSFWSDVPVKFIFSFIFWRCLFQLQLRCIFRYTSLPWTGCASNFAHLAVHIFLAVFDLVIIKVSNLTQFSTFESFVCTDNSIFSDQMYWISRNNY